MGGIRESLRYRWEKWRISNCWKSLLDFIKFSTSYSVSIKPACLGQVSLLWSWTWEGRKDGRLRLFPGPGTRNSTSEVSSRAVASCAYSALSTFALLTFSIPLSRERFESRFWLMEDLKSIRTSCRSKLGRRAFKELGNEPVAAGQSPRFFIFRRALLPVLRSDHGLGSTGSYETPNFPLPGHRADKLGFIKVMLLFKTEFIKNVTV